MHRPTLGFGRELWSTDGTVGGTAMVTIAGNGFSAAGRGPQASAADAGRPAAGQGQRSRALGG